MADLHLGGGVARLVHRPSNVTAWPGPTRSAHLFWQAWRWTAYLAVLVREGRAFLPRGTCVPATDVGRIGDRKQLFHTAGTDSLRWLAGRVVGGDWDVAAAPVEDHLAYASFRQHFLDGRPWEATPYRQEIARQVASGVSRIGCRSSADIERKFRDFDRLWEIVGTPTYRRGAGAGPYRPWEDVLLGIGRDGELVLVDGRHRLILAHLKRARLPATLVLRHQQTPRRGAHRSR